MAINFAAANMAGYNNPHISVLTINLDNDMNVLNSPSYHDVYSILSGGGVPIINGILRGNLSAAYLCAVYEHEIHFSTPAGIYGPEGAGLIGRMYIKFKEGIDTPEVIINS